MLTFGHRTRRGFSLVELLITMALLGLVSSVIVTVVVRQQRFYRSTAALMDARAQIRQIGSLLPADLRGISSVGGGIMTMSDSALEFRSAFGSSVVCTLISGATPAIVLPPLNTAKGLRLTSWTRAPIAGDSIVLYDVSATMRAGDDRWSVHQITAVATVAGDVATGCPSTSRLVQAADMVASNPAYRLTLSPVRPATVTQGAAVRLYRRVRYSLYRAADSQWYLGYRDCLPTRVPACSATQPIGGPFRGYATPGSERSGVQFTYFDSTGAVTAIPQRVARISLALRGETAGQLQLSGGGIGTLKDSLVVEVALRNRK